MLDTRNQRKPRSFESLIKNHCTYKAFLDIDAPNDPKLRNARVQRLRYYFLVGVAWAEYERTRRLPDMPQKFDSDYPLMKVEPTHCMVILTMETGRAWSQLCACLGK